MVPDGILRIPGDLARMFGVVAADVFGPDGNRLPGSGRRQAIFDRQAIQLGIKLLDAESGRDLAGFAADGRKLDLGRNRVDDHDQFGRMRTLRPDLAGTVERADIEPVFAVDARPEEEVSLLWRGLPPIVPMHAPVRRYVQLDLDRFLGGPTGRSTWKGMENRVCRQ